MEENKETLNETEENKASSEKRKKKILSKMWKQNF